MKSYSNFFFITLIILFLQCAISIVTPANSLSTYFQSSKRMIYIDVRLVPNSYLVQNYPGNMTQLTIIYTTPQNNIYQFIFTMTVQAVASFQYNWTIICINQTNTGALLNVSSPFGISVYSLQIKYLVISNQFPFLSSSYVQLSQNTNSIGNVQIMSSIMANSYMLPTSKYIIGITGIVLMTSSSFSLISVQAYWGNQSAINIAVNLIGSPNTPTFISFYILHWNQTYFNTSSGIIGSFYLNSVQVYPSNNLIPIDLNANQIIFDSITGIYQINQGYISVSISIVLNNITYNSWPYISSQISYLIILVSRCSYLITPYYLTNLCYLHCPQFYCSSNLTWTCDRCLYDCATCTNTTSCESCDLSVSHRQFDNSTKRCLPISRYYDNGAYVALPCSFQCITCVNLSICTVCVNNSNKCHNSSGIYCNCCGDWKIADYQTCDDGNNVGGDGCSATCMVQVGFCALGYYFNTTNNICEQCPYNCILCLNYGTCFKCKIGVPVIGGCTTVRGCSEVSIALIYSSTCISCSSPDWTINGSYCNCTNKNAWIIGNHCTQVIGCLVVNIIKGNSVCSICNYYKNFIPIDGGGNCKCIKGFQLSKAKDNCVDICGDGLNFDYECDDGNTLSGDGCSSTCKLQKKFICSKGNYTASSVCVYQSKIIYLFVASINKTQGLNQGVFVFRIKPSINLFKQNGVITNVSFNCLQKFNVSKWSQTNGQIEVTVDYFEDLEANMANVSVQFNKSRMLIGGLTLNFSMVSNGVKLYFYRDYSSVRLCELIMLIVSGVILAIALFSFFTHKMIGVQLLNTFQTVYYLTLTDVNKTVYSVITENLTILNFNFLYFKNKSTNFETMHSIREFSQGNLFFSQLAIASIIIFGLIAVLGKLFLNNLMDKNEKKRQQKQIKTTKLKYKILDKIIFPTIIGFFYLIFFSFFDRKYFPLLSMRLFLFSATSLLYWFEVKQSLIPRKGIQKKGYYENYVLVYLLFLIMLQTTVYLGSKGYISTVPQTILGINLLFMLWLILYRPYKHCLHNIGQFFNIFLMIFTSLNIIIQKRRDQKFDESTQYLLMIGVLIPLMILSIVLACVRSIKQLSTNLKICQFANKLKKNQSSNSLRDSFTHANPVQYNYLYESKIMNDFLPQMPQYRRQYANETTQYQIKKQQYLKKYFNLFTKKKNLSKIRQTIKKTNNEPET